MGRTAIRCQRWTGAFPLPGAKLALASGAVDAWSTWEVYTSAAELAGLVRVVRDGNGFIPGLSFAVASHAALVSKRALLADYAARPERALALTVPTPYA